MADSVGSLLRLAEQGGDQRPHEEDGADQARHRIAGEAEHARLLDAAEHQRLAGAHGDPPEIERQPGLLERVLDEIVVADRGAADGQHHVGGQRQSLLDRPGDGGAVVADDAEVVRLRRRAHST